MTENYLPLIRTPKVYVTTRQLLDELGLDEEPVGVPRDGVRPEVERPTTRRAMKERGEW